MKQIRNTDGGGSVHTDTAVTKPRSGGLCRAYHVHIDAHRYEYCADSAIPGLAYCVQHAPREQLLRFFRTEDQPDG